MSSYKALWLRPEVHGKFVAVCKERGFKVGVAAQVAVEQWVLSSQVTSGGSLSLSDPSPSFLQTPPEDTIVPMGPELGDESGALLSSSDLLDSLIDVSGSEDRSEATPREGLEDSSDGDVSLEDEWK